MTSQEESDSAPPSRVFLDAVLHPYRSLPPGGFAAVMAVLAGASLAAGVICILIGAWPVFGFFGLDVGLVYVAFRASYRSARQHERVRLTERTLTVERVSARGTRRRWQFEPYWLRVICDEREEAPSLTIASHGRSLTIGSFLPPGERCGFAAQLKGALARWRSAASDGAVAQ